MLTREEAKDFEITYGIKIEKELQLKTQLFIKEIIWLTCVTQKET